MRSHILGSLALLFSLPALSAQTYAVGACTPGDEGATNGILSWFVGHQERVCEFRRITLPVTAGAVTVLDDNGSIEVVGENRRDIFLEARVDAQASSRGQALDLLHQVRLTTVSNDLRAEGPHPSGRSWSVSYRLSVPSRIAANLRTDNGGITVADIEGAISAETTNGGLTLNNLAGDVHAETTNGGIHVQLAGLRWQGQGMKAETTNGGIHVQAPDHYSAHLVADTTNGGVHVEFPITVSGSFSHHLDTNLGQGGPTLEFQTTNGGVHIEHGGASGQQQHADSEDREE